MLIKRRNEIINYLREKNNATLEELCIRFNVSINTIRRDIEELEEQGLLKKVYGGVVITEKKVVIPMSVRQLELGDEKARIGKAAAALVGKNDVIVVDAGSTTSQMIRYLRDKSVTIITNSVNVLNEALPYENLKVILTGGTLMRDTNSLVGKDVIDLIKKFNANITFLAATGISINRGITNSSIPEADIKAAVMEASNKRVLMIDHTKFETVSLVSFARLNEVHTVITDREPDKEYSDYFKENNIELIIVE